MSFDDWMLALHVLSAFAMVAGLTLFWVLIVAGWRTDTPADILRMGPLSKVAGAAIGIGMGGTIVLWIAAAALGQRTNAAFEPPVKKAQELQAAGQTGPSAELLALNRTTRGLVLQVLVSIVILLIVIDMVWKPGA